MQLTHIMQTSSVTLHWTVIFIIFINHLTSHGWCSSGHPESDVLRLNVSNNGPGVFDSNITFVAVLSYENGSVADQTRYNYSWQHDAQILHLFTDPEYTEGYHNSSISKTFSKELFLVPPGNYSMFVTVWPKGDHTRQVANATTVFMLTDELNMELVASQHMDVPLPSNTFCTCKNITLTAVAQDEFTHAKYEYTWKIPGQKQRTTSQPNISVRLPSVGNRTLQVDVLANGYEGGYNFTKKGAVSLNITLKDGLHCVFEETPNLLIGQHLDANISCNGSPNYTICANIIPPDGIANRYCKEIRTSRIGFLSLDYYKLQHSGTYLLNITAINLVSEVAIEANVDVGGVPQSAGVVVGCIFVAIFFMFIIALAYYYDIRHRGEQSEETADFNFHPLYRSIDETNGTNVPEILHKMKRTLAEKVAAWKNKYREWSEERGNSSQRNHPYSDEDYTQPSAPPLGSEDSSICSYGSVSTVDA